MQSFILLNRFDSNQLPEENLHETITYEIAYSDAINAIAELKKELVKQKETSASFGNQKDDSFKGILDSIL